VTEPDPLSVVLAGNHDASGPSAADASRVDRPLQTRRIAATDPSTGSELDASRAAGGTRRACAWCDQPIPPAARRDAICCSVRCRQARHRFTRTVGRGRSVVQGPPLRLATPIRPTGQSLAVSRAPRLRRGGRPPGPDPSFVDVRRVALSTSAAALPAVLSLCPPGVRVAAWHRGERPAASRWPLNAWEPVIYHGGRPVDASRVDARRVDSLVHGVSR